MRLRITLSFARLLRMLLSAEVNAAEFGPSNKKLLTQFLDDNVLEVRMIGRQQRKLVCTDRSNLANYLHNKFEIPSLDDYIDFLEKEEIDRSDAVKAVSDTKFRKTKVFTGFLLNCYEEITCELCDASFSVKPGTGSFTFVSAYKRFKIPSDITVVVVEGHENFRDIERQKYLFEGLNPLFVWRFQNSSAVVQWLNQIPNDYIHFGDFDPKGIHIYFSEFKNKIKGERGSFLIPPDIDVLLIKYGEKALFEKQEKYWPFIHSVTDPKITSLIELMTKHKKGLAQEALIR